MRYIGYHHNCAPGIAIFFSSCISRAQVKIELHWWWEPRRTWRLMVSLDVFVQLSTKWWNLTISASKCCQTEAWRTAGHYRKPHMQYPTEKQRKYNPCITSSYATHLQLNVTFCLIGDKWDVSRSSSTFRQRAAHNVRGSCSWEHLTVVRFSTLICDTPQYHS